jgi:thymidylate synthase
MGGDEKGNSGNIPVICVSGANLAEAWEKAIVRTWEEGASVRTEYDRKDKSGKFIDPPSRDATVIVEVADPFAEPRIHKNFPGGPEELEVYRQEVVDGIHDHWVDPTDPDKWTYTYHERMFSYKATTDVDDPSAPSLPPFDQIEYAINKCAATYYSRRAQAITWIPNADPNTDDPPCLQRLWFRVLMNEAGEPVLNLNTHWRSRDGYKAWFMNAFALTDLQRAVAARISEQMGREVKVGRYVDISDSFHIYGSYFGEFQPEFEKMKADADYTTRAWPSDHPAVQMMFEDARRKLAENVDYMRSK